MRGTERQLDSAADHGRTALQELIGRMKRILPRSLGTKASGVRCTGRQSNLARSKARTLYESDVKVSITTTHREGRVVGMRSMPGNPYDGHTLPGTGAGGNRQRRYTRSGRRGQRVQGVAIDGVTIYDPGLRRGIPRLLRAMIRRAQRDRASHRPYEDGRGKRWNWLKGARGDAIHAVLCGAGHDRRTVL